MSTLHHIRDNNPLIHCITNYVTANFVANGLLAIGASPVMADAIEEINEMTAMASGLLLNIGTLNSRTVQSMLAAGKRANAKKIPVVLDPVGVGATSYRKETVRSLLDEVSVAVIRGNAGELAAIADVPWEAKGVDSGTGYVDIVSLAKSAAIKYGCVVAVTGAVDVVTDGVRHIEIAGGDARMPNITGSGCLLSALCCAGAAVVSGGSYYTAVAEVMAFYKRVGEYAGERSAAIGNFGVEVLNGIQQLREGSIQS